MYFQLCFPILRCSRRSPYWRRRSNCFTNFYTLLFYLIRKRREIHQRRRDLQSSMSITSAYAGDGLRGHHHASDFIYASPYELIDKNNNNADSEIYIPASVSLRMTPPPLPQRNNNYSPSPRMAAISSQSSTSTPDISQAFPNTPSPILAAKNHELKVSLTFFSLGPRPPAATIRFFEDCEFRLILAILS